MFASRLDQYLHLVNVRRFYLKRLTNEDKRAMICKCYGKSQLALRSTRRKVFGVFDCTVLYCILI